MKRIYTLKTVLITAVIFTFGINQSNAQVGIGNTSPQGALDISTLPNPNANGLLIPRVALALTTTATVLTPTVSEMVYNTATAGDVTPGFYYWDGAKWVRIVTGTTSNGWTTTGNAGTAPATNFVGTTNAVDLVFRTNNTEKMRVGSNGSVAINTGAAPSAFEKLQVNHTGSSNDAILAINNDNGVGLGNAVWARNTNATGTAIVASSGAITPSVSPNIGAGISGSHVDGYGVFGYCGNGNPGTVAHNGHAGAAFLLDSDNLVTTDNNSVFVKIAGKDNQDPDGPGGVAAANILYGGYFQSGVGAVSYSYTGVLYNHNPPGTTGTNYKVIGNGAASTIIPDSNNKPRVMFCPEAPEVLFEDYGVSKLINGETYIKIDEILAKSLKIDETHPLKVFIQLEGDCNGVYVTQKSINGFKVKELNKGNSNVSFSWHIVGTRADSKDENGNITSEFENLRLPFAPTKLKEDILIQKENPKTK